MAKRATAEAKVAETVETGSKDLETTGETVSEPIDPRLPTMEEPELEILNKMAAK